MNSAGASLPLRTASRRQPLVGDLAVEARPVHRTGSARALQDQASALVVDEVLVSVAGEGNRDRSVVSVDASNRNVVDVLAEDRRSSFDTCNCVVSGHVTVVLVVLGDSRLGARREANAFRYLCLLYTSDAADD